MYEHCGNARALETAEALAGWVRNWTKGLSDAHMQPMSGLALVAELRSDGALAHARVIMVTADRSLDHVRAAKAAGVDDYIVKPFTGPILKAKIEALFGNKNKDDYFVDV